MEKSTNKQTEPETKQEVKHPDPSALGLFGLAMVTLVASSQKLGLTDGVALVLPWAIFLGSFAQLIAGFYDYKKNNVFGATAFLGYGLFWLGVAFTWLETLGTFGSDIMEAADISQLGIAYLGYFIFTFYMTIGSTKTNKVLFAIFVLITCLFLFLALHTFGIARGVTGFMAGLTELLIAVSSFYLSAANILSIQFGKQMLPIGKPIIK